VLLCRIHDLREPQLEAIKTMTRPFRKKIGLVESSDGSAGSDVGNIDHDSAFPADLSTSPGAAASAGSAMLSDPTALSAGIDTSGAGNSTAVQSGGTATVVTAATVAAAASSPVNLQNAVVANA
jgi:hypothetical protein